MNEIIISHEESITGGLPPSTGDENAGREIPAPGFLELVYGIFFAPAATFHKIHGHPPYIQTVIIFTMVNIITYAMNGLVASHFIYLHATGHTALFMKVIWPAIGILGLFFQYIKWFFYSAFLHLTAEFLGGKGKATGVWVVAGLACLPAILLTPVNLLLIITGLKGVALSLVSSLFSLVVLIWGAVLLVLGVRQEHALSTRRAITTVVFIPTASFLAATIILLITFLVTATSFWPLLPKLNY